jgi:predicted membrane metal-binding protein
VLSALLLSGGDMRIVRWSEIDVGYHAILLCMFILLCCVVGCVAILLLFYIVCLCVVLSFAKPPSCLMYVVCGTALGSSNDYVILTVTGHVHTGVCIVIVDTCVIV